MILFTHKVWGFMPMDHAIIFDVLKNALKAQHKTYKELAEHLEVSELTVKRLFMTQDCKLSRLVQICDFLQIKLDELLGFSERYNVYPQYLPQHVEGTLAKDRVLFGIFLLIISNLTTEDVLRVTQFTTVELYRRLRQLEDLEVIKLRANDEFIITVPLPIAWRRDGALANVLKTINLDYLAYCFDRHQEPEHHYYSTSRMMSMDSSQTIKQQLEEVYRQFQQLATQDQIFRPSNTLKPYKLQIAHSLLPVDKLFFNKE